MALDPAGEIVCWGNDDYDQCADAPTGTFVHLSAARHRSCALDPQHHIHCWGTSSLVPQPPEGEFVELTLGSNACGVRQDGYIVCWGYDEWGETTPP